MGSRRDEGARAVTFGEYLAGLEGLAVLRHVAAGDAAAATARVNELAALVAVLDQPPLSAARQLPAVDALTGYREWATSYDGDKDNVTVALEEQAVEPMIGRLPPGLALDAGCGTGRHTVRLAAAGRAVVGVDTSAEMIERARRRVPHASFEVGNLERLPFPDASFAAVICGLALSHLPRLEAAVLEIGRVLRSGGRAIVSSPHPWATALLAFQARFERADGSRAYIPEYAHGHASYIDAFGEAGLRVARCVEPTLTAAMARAKARHGFEDAYEAALAALPVVLVWELERV